MSSDGGKKAVDNWTRMLTFKTGIISFEKAIETVNKLSLPVYP